MPNQIYAGFWIRTVATIIDTFLMMCIILPVVLLIYGDDFEALQSENFQMLSMFFNYVLLPIILILFWLHRSATPGKIILKLSIVDANSGLPISLKQSIIRYVGYYLSIIPFMLGFVWVAFDKRKQGFHDKFARTLVIKTME